MFWGGFFYVSYTSFVLWRHGEDGIVLPIIKYETLVRNYKNKKGTKEMRSIHYSADLTVQLGSGGVLIIPQRGVTMKEIEESRQRKLFIKVRPENPEDHYLIDNDESTPFKLFKLFSLACVTSFISFAWFRRRD
jgi:hypothetical protein